MGKLSGAEKKVVPVVYALVPKEPLSSRRDEECSSVSFGNTWNQEHEQEGTRNTWARSAASSSVTLIPKATLLFRRNKRNKRKQQRNNRAILLCSSQVRSRRKT